MQEWDQTTQLSFYESKIYRVIATDSSGGIHYRGSPDILDRMSTAVSRGAIVEGRLSTNLRWLQLKNNFWLPYTDHENKQLLEEVRVHPKPARVATASPRTGRPTANQISPTLCRTSLSPNPPTLLPALPQTPETKRSHHGHHHHNHGAQLQYAKGDMVEAVWPEDGYFYPAKIVEVQDGWPPKYRTRYQGLDDTENKWLNADQIRPAEDPTPLDPPSVTDSPPEYMQQMREGPKPPPVDPIHGSAVGNTELIDKSIVPEGFCMHMIDLINADATTDQQIILRRKFLKHILEAVRRTFGPDAKLHVYGSVAFGVDSTKSDLDLGLEIGAQSATEPGDILARLSDQLWFNHDGDLDDPDYDDTGIDPEARDRLEEESEDSMALKTEVTEILHARVPILKIEVAGHGLDADVSIWNSKHDHVAKLFRLYSKCDVRVIAFLKCVKKWAKHRGICDSRHGKLNSFCIYLMALQVLQMAKPPVVPRLQPNPDNVFELWSVKRCERWVSQNRMDLSQLLLFFFESYACNFDPERHVISVRLGKFREKSGYSVMPKQQRVLCVADPITPQDNTARQVKSTLLNTIMQEYRRGYQKMRDQCDYYDLCSLQRHTNLEDCETVHEALRTILGDQGPLTAQYLTHQIRPCHWLKVQSMNATLKTIYKMDHTSNYFAPLEPARELVIGILTGDRGFMRCVPVITNELKQRWRLRDAATAASPPDPKNVVEKPSGFGYMGNGAPFGGSGGGY